MSLSALLIVQTGSILVYAPVNPNISDIQMSHTPITLPSNIERQDFVSSVAVHMGVHVNDLRVGWKHDKDPI